MRKALVTGILLMMGLTAQAQDDRYRIGPGDVLDVRMYNRNLQVDIFVKEYHSRQVAIIGAVNEQGRFQLQRRIRLLELLTFAKGPSAKAGQTINIVHS